MISEKQKMILDFASRNNNQISKVQAVQVIGNCYFINGSKHTGEVLSRMVKSQLLKRVKNGFYLYSDKDPGSSMAFVVLSHNNPSEDWYVN